MRDERVVILYNTRPRGGLHSRPLPVIVQFDVIQIYTQASWVTRKCLKLMDMSIPLRPSAAGEETSNRVFPMRFALIDGSYQGVGRRGGQVTDGNVHNVTAV